MILLRNFFDARDQLEEQKSGTIRLGFSDRPPLNHLIVGSQEVSKEGSRINAKRRKVGKGFWATAVKV
jgi:hypothetical protein